MLRRYSTQVGSGALRALSETLQKEYKLLVDGYAHQLTPKSTVLSANYIDSTIYRQFTNVLNKGFVTNLDTEDYMARKSKGTKLPEPPTDPDSRSLNRYVTLLASTDYRHVQSYVSEIYQTLSNSSLLSVHSFNLLIGHFARQYKTLECYKLREKMEKLGKRPGTETINIILDITFRKHHFSKKEKVLEYLRLFNKSGDEKPVRPNGTTLHVMYKGLEDPDLKEKLLARMVEAKVPLLRIASEIVEQKLQNGQSEQDVRDFLWDNHIRWTHPSIAAQFVDHLLSQDKPDAAWSVILEASSANKKPPSFRLVRKMHWYFIQQNQFYNCIALANHLRMTLDYTEDFEGWNYLLSKMVHLRPFNYWCIIARKLYQINLVERTKIGSKQNDLLTAEDYSAINAYGHNLDSRFDISLPFESNLEKKLADEVVRRLFWTEAPKWRLEDNSEEFQKAAEVFM